MSQLPDPDMPLLKDSTRQVDMVQGNLSIFAVVLILVHALWASGSATWNWVDPNPALMTTFWFLMGTKIVVWCASALIHQFVSTIITRGSEFAVEYLKQTGMNLVPTALTVSSAHPAENVIPLSAHRKLRIEDPKGPETDEEA